MKIYIEDEMIINTEQVKFFRVIEKTTRVFELIAIFGIIAVYPWKAQMICMKYKTILIT